MLPVEKFRDFAEGMVERGRDVLVRDGRHHPILFVFPEKDPVAIVAIGPFKDKRVKAHQVVGDVVRQLGGKAFIFISEAWVASTDVATGLRFAQEGVDVKSIPGRGEALTIMAMHPEGRFMWEVPFSREGGQMRFGRVQCFEGETLLGAMADILETP